MQPPIRCNPGLLQKDLTGKTYIVTGANSGVGLATAKQLASQGAHVVSACRRVDAGIEAIADFSGKGSIEVMELDLGNLESCKSFVEAFKAKHSSLHGLVNNAGVMACPEGKTVDGFETQFGVCHLGHFYITELLLETLKASAPARIVCVSSVLHVGSAKEAGTIDLDDPNFENRPYDKNIAYTQAKLANVLHALELSERLKDSGVTSYSVHPGWVRSNLAQHVMPVWIQNVLMRPFSGMLGLMDSQDGAQTTLHCLLDDDAPNHSGEYYSQTSILYPEKAHRGGGWPMESPNPNAKDKALASQLYEKSTALVGLPLIN